MEPANFISKSVVPQGAGRIEAAFSILRDMGRSAAGKLVYKLGSERLSKTRIIS
jgi:hypothetical protein